ncbi:hypothetical protein M0802_004135 [Mischocyttarus mexicanus]|nr:hypothetical protein M0802_004135 [Mischocyttarus mexicanus]
MHLQVRGGGGGGEGEEEDTQEDDHESLDYQRLWQSNYGSYLRPFAPNRNERRGRKLIFHGLPRVKRFAEIEEDEVEVEEEEEEEEEGEEDEDEDENEDENEDEVEEDIKPTLRTVPDGPFSIGKVAKEIEIEIKIKKDRDRRDIKIDVDRTIVKVPVEKGRRKKRKMRECRNAIERSVLAASGLHQQQPK